MSRSRITEPGLSRALVVDCARLSAGAVDCMEVRRQCVLEDAGISTARVIDGLVDVDVVVRTAGSAFVVVGRLRGTWVSECRRCLEEMLGPVDVPFDEVFEWDPSEGETWPINDQRIDLGPAARETAMLALPLAPLCSPECVGPEPDRFPTGPAEAPRRGGSGRP